MMNFLAIGNQIVNSSSGVLYFSCFTKIFAASDHLLFPRTPRIFVAKTTENMHTTTDVAATLPLEEHPAPATAPPPAKRVLKRYVPLERFLLRYTNREDPYKYEWNNGVVEKKARTMNRDQLFIAQNLLKRFILTKAFAEKGALLCEIDFELTVREIFAQ